MQVHDGQAALPPSCPGPWPRSPLALASAPSRLVVRFLAAANAEANPDAELLRLEPAFDIAEAEVSAAWAMEDSEETEAISDAALARMHVVLDAIELLHAQTLACLKFKLRAVSWCTQGKLSAVDLADDPQPASDTRLLAGLLADLSAMRSAVS